MVGAAVIEINRLAAPAALKPVWLALEGRSDASFFLSWNWIGTWLETTGARPLVVTLRQGDSVLGLALVQDSRQRRLGVIPVRVGALHETGAARQDSLYIEYNGALCAPEAPAQAFGRMLRAVMAQSVDELRLSAIAPALVAQAQAIGWVVTTHSAARCYAVDLAALRAAGGAYVDSLGANARQQIRRSARLYAARGAVTLAPAASLAQAREFFAGLTALHRQTWQRRGQAGAFADPFFRRFHDRLLEVLWPQGAVEVLRIAAGAQAIGYLYNFRHRGSVLNYQSGFAPETDNRLKPGLLSHALCVERHLSGTASRYDLMAGEARYKQSLAAPHAELAWITLQRPGLLTHAQGLARRLKQALRRHPNSLA